MKTLDILKFIAFLWSSMVLILMTIILLQVNQKCSCLIDKTFQYNSTLINNDYVKIEYIRESNYCFYENMKEYLDVCNINNNICLLRYDSKNCILYYILVPTISIFVGIIGLLLLLKIYFYKKNKNVLEINHIIDDQPRNNNDYRRLSE